MIELNTGYLDFEQLDAEVVNIADDLLAFDIGTVYVSFGFGCRKEKLLQTEDIPVSVRALVRFIADSESEETFALGESDLLIRAGGVEFKLCHERDVHCSGEENQLLAAD